jgi:hypothetical protein
MRSSRPRISPGTSPHRSHASRASRPLIGLGAGATPFRPIKGRAETHFLDEDAGARHRVMNFLGSNGAH